MYFIWTFLHSCNIKSGCLLYSVQINNKTKKHLSFFFFMLDFLLKTYEVKLECKL